MRHDPAAAAIVIMLRSLKMYGMAQAVEDLIEQGAPAFEAAIPTLSQLLKAELAEREVRSIRCPAGDPRSVERDRGGADDARRLACGDPVPRIHPGPSRDDRRCQRHPARAVDWIWARNLARPLRTRSRRTCPCCSTLR